MIGIFSRAFRQSSHGPVNWVLLGALLSLLVPASAQSLKATLSEEADLHAKLKTAYLFNTAKFVSWDTSQTNIRLCLRGQSETPRLAAKLDGRALGDGRNLTVLHGAEDSTGCHIVYDDQNAADTDKNKLLEKIDTQQVLLISDNEHALSIGYTMQFFVQDDSVRFALDNDRIKSAKFRMSSKLQRLARSINGR